MHIHINNYFLRYQAREILALRLNRRAIDKQKVSAHTAEIVRRSAELQEIYDGCKPREIKKWIKCVTNETQCPGPKRGNARAISDEELFVVYKNVRYHHAEGHCLRVVQLKALLCSAVIKTAQKDGREPPAHTKEIPDSTIKRYMSILAPFVTLTAKPDDKAVTTRRKTCTEDLRMIATQCAAIAAAIHGPIMNMSERNAKKYESKPSNVLNIDVSGFNIKHDNDSGDTHFAGKFERSVKNAN